LSREFCVGFIIALKIYAAIDFLLAWLVID
jgi:hypothetical protein